MINNSKMNWSSIYGYRQTLLAKKVQRRTAEKQPVLRLVLTVRCLQWHSQVMHIQYETANSKNLADACTHHTTTSLTALMKAEAKLAKLHWININTGCVMAFEASSF